MDTSSEVRVESRSKSKQAISKIVLSAMMLALAVVLEYVAKLIPFFSWPAGGSVSITMVPLIMVSLYCGPVYGTVIAIAYSVINFFIDGVTGWTPNVLAVCLSLLLDYVIGFGCCGLAAFFRRPFFEKKAWAPVAAVVLCCLVRLVSSVLSGVIVFTQGFDYDSASGLMTDFTLGGFIYSLTYNAGYMIPSMVLDVAIFIVLLKPIYTTFNTTVILPLLPEAVREDKKKAITAHKLMPMYLVIQYVFGILSMIPQLKMYYLGYFGAVLGVGLLAYEIYDMTKQKDEKDSLSHFIYLALIVIGLSLSIVGICSFVTYGQGFYTED